MGRAEPGVMGFALSIIFLYLPGYSGPTMKAIPIEQNAAQPILRLTTTISPIRPFAKKNRGFPLIRYDINNRWPLIRLLISKCF